MEISAAQFKARCLKLMDEVERTREPVIITKRGRPVARLTSVESKPAQPLFGCMAGTVTHEGDIVSPTGVLWETQAESEPNLYNVTRPSRKARRRSG